MSRISFKSKIPSGRYALFMRGNLLVFSGYLIATSETFLAIYSGLTILSYEKNLYICLTILSISSILILITYFKKNLLVWHEWLIFGVYLVTFLVAFCLWVYSLGALRILGIINALTAVTIVLSYTTAVQSLFMSMLTLICYYAVTWYAIEIAGQPGSLKGEAFLSFCLLPAFILISYAAYYINKRRKDLQMIKSELEEININLLGGNNKLKQEQYISEIEMDLAGDIQSAIFPGKTPLTSDWDIALMSKPYGTVTGDFYDFYSVDNSLKGISLFDVSGHGIAPALVTILAKPVLYYHFNRCRSLPLGDVLVSANSDLMNELEDVNVYITGLMLRMDGDRVEYANAGHPDLLYFSSSLKKVDIVTDSLNSFKGHPIGISSSVEKYQSIKFNVATGDYIVIYSDGLIESLNDSGDKFGITGLFKAILSFKGVSASELLNHIASSLEQFAANTKAADDITLIVAGKI